MAGNSLGVTKLSAQFQMPLIDYGGETRFKLRQNSGWDSARGSKRGQLEIMAEILSHCTQQKAKTDIMYKVNLNYVQLKKHLTALTSQSLLSTNKNKYSTTQKGYRFLELFIQLKAMLNS